MERGRLESEFKKLKESKKKAEQYAVEAKQVCVEMRTRGGGGGGGGAQILCARGLVLLCAIQWTLSNLGPFNLNAPYRHLVLVCCALSGNLISNVNECWSQAIRIFEYDGVLYMQRAVHVNLNY